MTRPERWSRARSPLSTERVAGTVLGAAASLMLAAVIIGAAAPALMAPLADAQQITSTAAAVVVLAIAATVKRVRGMALGFIAALVPAGTGLALWNSQPGAELPSAAADACFVVALAIVAGTIVPPVFVSGIERRQRFALVLDAAILVVAITTIFGAVWELLLAPAGWSGEIVPPLAGGIALITCPAAVYLGLLHRRVEPGLRGAYAVIDGLTLIGIAWIGWIAMSGRGNVAGVLVTDFLYSIGVLLVAWGGLTWRIEPSGDPRFGRMARVSVGAFPTIAVFLCVALELISPASSTFDVVKDGAACVVVLTLVRQILLLVGADRAARAERAARQDERVALAQLNREIEDRASVLSSLFRVEVGPTPTDTAREICRRAVELEDIEGAVVRVFDPTGVLVVLAVAGAADLPGMEGVRLSESRSREAAEKAAEGPYVEIFQMSEDAHLNRLFALGIRATVNGPLVYNERIVGVVGLSATSEASGELLSQRLTTAREFGLHAGALLGPGLAEQTRQASLRAAIAEIVEAEAFRPVFQPVMDIQSGATIGFEALTRFADGRRPDHWFADATACGMARELELGCLRRALVAAEDLPDTVWLSLNVSPEVAAEPAELADALRTVERRIVLEITERSAVENYGRIRAALAGLRPRVAIAIDDAGAGYSSLQHILEMEPDIVKLDIALVRAVDTNRARRALVSAMVSFARETNCTLLAEGIETESELATLRSLGVALGQGFLLARPAPAAEFASLRIEPAA